VAGRWGVTHSTQENKFEYVTEEKIIFVPKNSKKKRNYVVLISGYEGQTWYIFVQDNSKIAR